MNPTKEEIDGFEKAKTDPHTLFLVGQPELAPTTGTPHIQGYIETHNVKTGSALKSHYPWLKRAKLIQARGSREDNVRYCTKEETRIPGTVPSITENKKDTVSSEEKDSDEKSYEESAKSVQKTIVSMSDDEYYAFRARNELTGYWQTDEEFIKDCTINYAGGYNLDKAIKGWLGDRRAQQARYDIKYPCKFSDVKDKIIAKEKYTRY